MPKTQDEIEDDDIDTEEDVEDEDTDEEEDEADEAEESDDEAAAEDDDSDEDESDDDAALPKSRKEFDTAIAKAVKVALKSSRNREGAARRTSKDGKLTERTRSNSAKNDERLNSIEANQARLDKLEAKRQFGYDTGLAPDEVNVVFKLTSKPSKKSLSDPIIKGALDGYRADRRLRNNIPSGTGRPTKVSAKEEANMTPSERRDRLHDRRRQILSSKSR